MPEATSDAHFNVNSVRFKIAASPSFHALILLIVGACLCWSIWHRTGEIFLDFGTELCTAWRVAGGSVPYRDVACFYGPLSPEFNGLVMRICGARLDSILVANLLVLVLVTALLYRLVRTIAGPLCAFVGAAFFLLVFGLNSPTRIANYNFLTPYSHQITHGFLVTLASIACLVRFQRTASPVAAIFSGVFAGLAFLTKPEIFAGCFASLVMGVGAIVWLDPSRRAVKGAVAALVSVIVAPLAFFLCFAARMPWRCALGGVLSGWQFAGKAYVVSTPFYQGALGTDQPLHNVEQMLLYAGVYATVVCVIVLTGFAAKKMIDASRGEWGAVIIAAALTFCGLLQVGRFFGSFWSDAARGFPLLALIAVALSGARIFRRNGDEAQRLRNTARWILSVLSLAMLAKIFLNTRMYHYGFVLSVPCALWIIIALFNDLPACLNARGGSEKIARACAAGLLGAVVTTNVTSTRHNLAERTVQLKLATGETTWCRPLDRASVSAVDAVSRSRGTLAALPDAAGINFATLRPPSIPYLVFHPMSLAMFGESDVLRAFERSPPACIIITEESEHAFGADVFGRDYGIEISRWIVGKYRYRGTFEGDHPVELWDLR